MDLFKASTGLLVSKCGGLKCLPLLVGVWLFTWGLKCLPPFIDVWLFSWGLKCLPPLVGIGLFDWGLKCLPPNLWMLGDLVRVLSIL